MSVWHKVKCFALPAVVRAEYYVKTQYSWKDKIKCGCILPVLTLSIFIYYSDVFRADGSSAPTIWYIAITEYVVLSVLCFLTAVDDIALGVACCLSRLVVGCQ